MMTQQVTRHQQNVCPVATAGQRTPLGEQWTLVHEWYMERREPLQVIKGKSVEIQSPQLEKWLQFIVHRFLNYGYIDLRTGGTG